MKTNIKLARGEEIVINGYIVRAVGLDPKQPDQLQIRKRGWPTLWMGYCDEVVTAPAVILGANPEGLPANVNKRDIYIYHPTHNHSPTR